MSIKSKFVAAAATLALASGLATAGALTASAATPSCGHRCINLFSKKFSDVLTTKPPFVLDVFRQGANINQPIIMFQSSNADPAEDFTVSLQGTVTQFAAAGLLPTGALTLHYATDLAFEFQYSPNGVDSGLCVGVASTAVQHEGVTLAPCGVSAKTVWVVDVADSPATLNRGYVPLINGSTTNFSHPHVMTYPANGYPTDRPRPQIQVRNLTGFSNGFGPIIGTVIDTQLWGADFGVLR